MRITNLVPRVLSYPPRRLADYFANVALDFGGQHVHDLLEQDHQYHTSIESINRKHRDAAL